MDESLIFVKTNKIQTSKIIIEGKGYGMLSLGFEYEGNIIPDDMYLYVFVKDKQIVKKET